MEIIPKSHLIIWWTFALKSGCVKVKQNECLGSLLRKQTATRMPPTEVCSQGFFTNYRNIHSQSWQQQFTILNYDTSVVLTPTECTSRKIRSYSVFIEQSPASFSSFIFGLFWLFNYFNNLMWKLSILWPPFPLYSVLWNFYNCLRIRTHDLSNTSLLP